MQMVAVSCREDWPGHSLFDSARVTENLHHRYPPPTIVALADWGMVGEGEGNSCVRRSRPDSLADTLNHMDDQFAIMCNLNTIALINVMVSPEVQLLQQSLHFLIQTCASTANSAHHFRNMG